MVAGRRPLPRSGVERTSSCSSVSRPPARPAPPRLSSAQSSPWRGSSAASTNAPVPSSTTRIVSSGSAFATDTANMQASVATTAVQRIRSIPVLYPSGADGRSSGRPGGALVAPVGREARVEGALALLGELVDPRRLLAVSSTSSAARFSRRRSGFVERGSTTTRSCCASHAIATCAASRRAPRRSPRAPARRSCRWRCRRAARRPRSAGPSRRRCRAARAGRASAWYSTWSAKISGAISSASRSM